MSESLKYQELINQTAYYVKDRLRGCEGGHDWWHVYRVWRMAKHIAVKEKVDILVVELAALLHDIADSKFHNNDEEIGPYLSEQFLLKIGVEKATIEHVVSIIRNISFKNSFDKPAFYSKELAVVQDADRLDAIGAIGIARAFNFGGFKNRPLYDPDSPPKTKMTKEDYQKSDSPTLNHFYEKLLLLKDMMNTTTGKKIAKDRHRYLVKYLERFIKEWEGKL